MVNKSHHHFSHVHEVFSSHLVVIHHGSFHLTVDLVRKVLSFLFESFHLLGGIWQDILKGLGRVLLDFFCLNLIFDIDSPGKDILLFEKLFLLLQ